MGAIIGGIIAKKILAEVLKKSFFERAIPLIVNRVMDRFFKWLDKKKKKK